MKQVTKKSYNFLKNKHQEIIGSIHPTEIGTQTCFFYKIIQSRANGLIFTEDTMNFYQYNLDIKPDYIRYAVSYLMKLMSILLGHNPGSYNDLARLIYRTATKVLKIDKKELIDAECDEIVEAFENRFIAKSAEQIGYEQEEEKERERKELAE